jgi:hypothetical protein
MGRVGRRWERGKGGEEGWEGWGGGGRGGREGRGGEEVGYRRRVRGESSVTHLLLPPPLYSPVAAITHTHAPSLPPYPLTTVLLLTPHLLLPSLSYMPYSGLNETTSSSMFLHK